MGAGIFQKSSNHLKILGAKKVTRSKFHTEGTKMLGDTVHYTTWRPLSYRLDFRQSR